MEPSSRVRVAAIDQYRQAHIDAKDAVAFAAARMKASYDEKHQPRFFNVGDAVNLRLHHGYTISSLVGKNKKISLQFVGPLRVTELIGRLAYCVDIPATWGIHDVGSVAQLEPASREEDDPYKRPRPHKPDAVIMTPDAPDWDLERLLRKRTYRKGRGYATEYLARWLGYGSISDSWINIKDLGNVREFVDEFERKDQRDKEEVLQ